jgi:hypothetical protein
LAAVVVLTACVFALCGDLYWHSPRIGYFVYLLILAATAAVLAGWPRLAALILGLMMVIARIMEIICRPKLTERRRCPDRPSLALIVRKLLDRFPRQVVHARLQVRDSNAFGIFQIV